MEDGFDVLKDVHLGTGGEKALEFPSQLFLGSKLSIDNLCWPLNGRLHPEH